MKRQIESLADLDALRIDLEAKRDMQRLSLLKRSEALTKPMGIVSMVAKPLLNRISWFSVGMSVFKFGLSLFRKKRK